MRGLSGLGDLILTCSSPQSRNFSFGIALGEGKNVEDASGGKLVEGAFTAQVLREMAKKQKRRHADHRGGGRRARGKVERAARDRYVADAAVQGGGMTWRTGW